MIDLAPPYSRGESPLDEATLGWFSHYLLPTSIQDALDGLATWCDQVTVLSLHRELFPVEYAASTASTVATRGRAYSPRELECFQLIADRCFPFPVETFRTFADRQDTFWLPYMGIDLENLQSIGELRGGWQLIYFFAMIEQYDYDDEYFEEWMEAMDHGDLLAPILREPSHHGVNLPRFLHCCQERPAPWSYLPEAYAICAEVSDNPFYDAELQTGEDPEREEALRFTPEVMRWLTAEWQETLTIETHCDALMLWLDADPAHWVEVATLWANQQLPA